MDRRIVTAAVVSLVAVYGTANAAPPAVLTATSAASAPVYAMGLSDQREIIAPPEIDPGMVKTPPTTGARMPVIVPRKLGSEG